MPLTFCTIFLLVVSSSLTWHLKRTSVVDHLLFLISEQLFTSSPQWISEQLNPRLAVPAERVTAILQSTEASGSASPVRPALPLCWYFKDVTRHLPHSSVLRLDTWRMQLMKQQKAKRLAWGQRTTWAHQPASQSSAGSNCLQKLIPCKPLLPFKALLPEVALFTQLKPPQHWEQSDSSASGKADVQLLVSRPPEVLSQD